MRIKKTSQTTTMSAQVVNTYDESTENAYSCDYINENFGEIVWINIIGSSSFAGRTITASLNDYESFKIGYFADNNTTVILTKLGGKGVNIDLTYGTAYNRQVAFSNNSITFGDGYYSGSVNNNAIIPAFVIGYK